MTRYALTYILLLFAFCAIAGLSTIAAGRPWVMLSFLATFSCGVWLGYAIRSPLEDKPKRGKGPTILGIEEPTDGHMIITVGLSGGCSPLKYVGRSPLYQVWNRIPDGQRAVLELEFTLSEWASQHMAQREIAEMLAAEKA